MPAKNQELAAVQQIVNALQPLDGSAQDRVLGSVLALLGKAMPTAVEFTGGGERGENRREAGEGRVAQRPKGLTELLSEKNPGTNSQRIALFAYYRDKYEAKSRFSRGELKTYFVTARLEPPANYDRDFNGAVEKGWIHESGDQSYITTSGIEAAEQGFEGERVYVRRRGGTKKGAPKRRGVGAKKATKRG